MKAVVFIFTTSMRRSGVGISRFTQLCQLRVFQTQAHMQGASEKQHHAQKDFDHGQVVAGRGIAIRAHHTFGEIEPNDQAHPAVGVHAVFQQTRQWYAQGQHFEGQQCATGAHGSEPQLSCEAKHDQPHQTAHRQQTGERHMRGQGVVGRRF